MSLKIKLRMKGGRLLWLFQTLKFYYAFHPNKRRGSGKVDDPVQGKWFLDNL